jgi:predicted nucleotidyltransferase component of viral defense system
MSGSPENEALMVRLINLLAGSFPAQAILKGGMELRLLNCPRYTNDLDYVFVPFSSKKDIAAPVLQVLGKQEDLKIEHTMHSTCMRIIASAGKIRVQIELNVASECKTQELTTADLARAHHLQGRIIRAMSLDTALAHKLAAWLERGLMRDLYDIYFIRETLGIAPDLNTLSDRLRKISYQRHGNRGPKTMTMPQFAAILRQAAGNIGPAPLHEELQDQLDPEEFPGLDLKIGKALRAIAEMLDRNG